LKATRIAARNAARVRVSILAAVSAFAVGACAPGASVQPAPTPVYAVSISNSTPGEVVVSYDDGTAARALGTVPPARTERFVIASPASTTVRILARDASGDPSYGPFTVSLIAGSTVSVTIQ
jgi:hypothetical protein